jgi:glycosyltransferase involved in cell wall biosynthesis
MACGTPCVTTDVGDAALIVGDTGWVVPHSDPVALAGAILGALDEMGNLAKWNARKEACRKRVIQNYTLERMIKSYNRVWADAINDK